MNVYMPPQQKCCLQVSKKDIRCYRLWFSHLEAIVMAKNVWSFHMSRRTVSIDVSTRLTSSAANPLSSLIAITQPYSSKTAWFSKQTIKMYKIFSFEYAYNLLLQNHLTLLRISIRHSIGIVFRIMMILRSHIFLLKTFWVILRKVSRTIQ